MTTNENDSKENPMNNEIQKFKGASLRTLTDEAGEPWFVAKGQTYFIRRYCLQPSLEAGA